MYEGEEIYTWFWWGNLRKPLGEPRLDRKIGLKWFLKK